jgi:hypothetical protein
MRGVRLLSLTAAAALLIAAGCGTPHRDAAASPGASAAPRAQGNAVPAPKNPDLGTVMERFYQQVEGDHWPFAYAMLSPRYRATLTQTQLEERYARLVSPDVTLRQLDDTTVVTRIDAKDRADRTRAVHLEETVKLAWDGEAWTIDRITRRDLGAASTR